MHKLLFICIITFSQLLAGTSTVKDSYQNPIKADITLMYRRSGHTVKDYTMVASGDTLNFYKRDGNPFYRTYRMDFSDSDLSVNIGPMIIESYQGDSLTHSTRIIARRVPAASQRFQAIDTYVKAEETLVKVRLLYTLESDSTAYEFFFYILPNE